MAFVFNCIVWLIVGVIALFIVAGIVSGVVHVPIIRGGSIVTVSAQRGVVGGGFGELVFLLCARLCFFAGVGFLVQGVRHRVSENS